MRGIIVILSGLDDFINYKTYKLINFKKIISKKLRECLSVAYNYIYFDLIEIKHIFGN